MEHIMVDDEATEAIGVGSSRRKRIPVYTWSVKSPNKITFQKKQGYWGTNKGLVYIITFKIGRNVNSTSCEGVMSQNWNWYYF